MPIHTFWHNDEKTIVRYDFEGHWTWEEFHAAVNRVHDMMETVLHQRVDGIIDLTRSAMIPSGSLVHFRTGSAKAAANWGISVLVTTSTFINVFGDTIRRMLPNLASRYFVVKTVEEALQLIEEQRHKAQTQL